MGFTHSFVEQLCWKVDTNRFCLILHGFSMYIYIVFFSLWFLEKQSLSEFLKPQFVNQPVVTLLFFVGETDIHKLGPWITGSTVLGSGLASCPQVRTAQWGKDDVKRPWECFRVKVPKFSKAFSNYSNLENLFMFIFLGGSLVWNIAHKLLETRWQHVVVAVSAIFPSPVDLQVHHCCVLLGGVGHPFPQIENRL